MKKIWKLQRPMFTNGDYNEVMAYTEDKEDLAIIPMPKDVIEKLFDDELKIYVKAKVKNGNLVVDRQVEEQVW